MYERVQQSGSRFDSNVVERKVEVTEYEHKKHDNHFAQGSAGKNGTGEKQTPNTTERRGNVNTVGKNFGFNRVVTKSSVRNHALRRVKQGRKTPTSVVEKSD